MPKMVLTNINVRRNRSGPALITQASGIANELYLSVLGVPSLHSGAWKAQLALEAGMRMTLAHREVPGYGLR